MKNAITKRGKIRAFSFLISVFSVLLIFAISANLQANALKRQVRVAGERALCELDTQLDSIYTDLQKGVYATTPPMLSRLSEEISRSAAGAKTSLSVLPLSTAHMENTYKFLSQVGHFVETLDKKLQRGESITPQELEKMQKLLAFSKTLQDEMSRMRTKLFDGYVDFQKEQQILAEKEPEVRFFADDMEDTDQSLTEYPSLIYDGPFSDHILKKESAFLKTLPEISPKEAKKAAAAILGAKEEALETLSEEKTTTAAYRFRYGDKVAAITKNGGKLLYLLSSAFAGEEALKPEEATKKAAAFLEDIGYPNMQDSYYSVDDGICTINFAYTEGRSICYPDLIKVSVSLANGQILSADCRGYLMNHKSRTIPQPKITVEEAQKQVSPLLQVLSTKQAVIPEKSGNEKYTYEFHCKNREDQEFLVYMDTKTGVEDNILILLYADGGVLTK